MLFTYLEKWTDVLGEVGKTLQDLHPLMSGIDLVFKQEL